MCILIIDYVGKFINSMWSMIHGGIRIRGLTKRQSIGDLRQRYQRRFEVNCSRLMILAWCDCAQCDRASDYLAALKNAKTVRFHKYQ